MDQPTFADLEYQGKKRRTRRELFLQRMDGLIPWQRLEERIRPVYPKPGKGRRPYPLPVMLRIHCVQLFYNLSEWNRAAQSGRVSTGSGHTLSDRKAAIPAPPSKHPGIFPKHGMGQSSPKRSHLHRLGSYTHRN